MKMHHKFNDLSTPIQQDDDDDEDALPVVLAIIRAK